MSAARHVRKLDCGALGKDPGDRNPPAIVNIVLAVAAATIWLVVLPAARNEPAAQSSCELIVQVDAGIICGTGSSSSGHVPSAPSRALAASLP